MAGGGPIASAGGANVADYQGRLTGYVIVVALIAASGGLLFGYDLGVTGGVESFPEFQQKFFPEVYEANQAATDNDPYCKYDSQKLQIFTSSLFLAGLVMSIFAGHITRAFGRKKTMVFAGICFLIGAGLNAGAVHIAMLVIGRLMLGFGVGSANQVVPLYLSEMAPFKYRGGLNMLFQLATTIGILVAQLINYGVQDWAEGWRLSLGLAAVPALILFIGGLVLPESPNSLIERGHHAQGRKILEKLRGTPHVDAEFEDMQRASELAATVGLRQVSRVQLAVQLAARYSTAQLAATSWRKMFTRAYFPMLVCTVWIAIFQQFTGINAIMFYVPVLFSSLGSGKSAALLNTVIIGAVNVVSTFVSILTVDKFGRKALFLEGGIQMFLAQIVTGVVLATEFGVYTTGELPKRVAIGVLIVICVFVAGFAWSWGPLGWLVPSEIQTLETRAAGMSAAVVANFLFSFVIGQCFLTMLCSMKWGVFIFFAGFVAIMTTFVGLLLPETKGVPMERVHGLFARHWFWRKVMGPAADEIILDEEAYMKGKSLGVTEAAPQPMAAPAPFLVAEGGNGSNVAPPKTVI
ncbi:hypothetical protein N2152v2_010459 [Parachlorella kessleri]